jgi:GAF domain-containing protein
LNGLTTSDGSRPALARLFTQLGGDLVRAESIDAVLTVITRRAFELIPSAEHAAVSRGRKRQFETVAATSNLPPKVDQIQYRLGSGPCVDAIVERSAFRSGDLETDERWPEFGREAADRYGIHSMLSIRMFVEDEELRVGLNLYSAECDAFDESDETTATLLATHGALAVTAARRRDKISNLEFALSTSRHIGAAMGILMATQKVTDDQAFDLLRIASQATHRKVTEIADDVVRTGVLELPELPEDRRR